MADARRARTKPLPRGWARHPKERMLITPLMAGLGGLLAFFRSSRSSSGCRSTRSIRRPRPTGLRSRTGPQGTQPLRRERLLRLPLRLLASAGRPRGSVLPLPEGLAARRLLRERPVAEPARNRAHRARPLAGVGLASGRLAARALLRPALRRSALADAGDEVALLGPAGGAPDPVRREAKRQVRAAALRRPALREARRARTRASRRRTRGFQGAHKQILEAATRPEAAEGPARGGAEPLADRPRLLALRRSAAGDRAEPPAWQGSLPRALRRLPRPHRRRQGTGRGVYVARARRLHRQGRRMLRRRHRARRLLLPHPARLAGHRDGELRRSPLRQRHLARSALRQDDPEPHARRTSSPSRGTTSSGSRRKSSSPGSKTSRSSPTTPTSTRSSHDRS